MDLTILPLTPDLWPAFEDLFGVHGAVGGCWCMYWRIGNAYRQRPAADNKADFCQLLQSGPPPGLLAFQDGLAVGWCQLTPRSAVPWLDRTWRLKPLDELPVWSITCFYIRKGWRKRGITSALIAAALETAKAAGAPALEAYPLDGARSPSATSTGYVSTFEQAGFSIAARRSPERPVMRFYFQLPGSDPSQSE